MMSPEEVLADNWGENMFEIGQIKSKSQSIRVCSEKMIKLHDGENEKITARENEEL